MDQLANKGESAKKPVTCVLPRPPPFHHAVHFSPRLPSFPPAPRMRLTAHACYFPLLFHIRPFFCAYAPLLACLFVRMACSLALLPTPVPNPPNTFTSAPPSSFFAQVGDEAAAGRDGKGKAAVQSSRRACSWACRGEDGERGHLHICMRDRFEL